MSTAEPEKSASPAEVKKRADSGNHIIGRLGSLVSTSLSFSEDEDDSYLASTLKAAKALTKCTSAVTNIFQLAGHIHLRIKYITPKIVRAGKLMVRVVEARDLDSKSATGTCAPYVKVQYGKSKYRSSVIKKNLNPFWNEEFTFEVPIKAPPIDLILEVWDWNRTRDDYIGEVKLNLPDFKVGENDEAELDEWFPLKAAQLEEKDGPDPEQEMIQEAVLSIEQQRRMRAKMKSPENLRRKRDAVHERKLQHVTEDKNKYLKKGWTKSLDEFVIEESKKKELAVKTPTLQALLMKKKNSQFIVMMAPLFLVLLIYAINQGW